MRFAASVCALTVALLMSLACGSPSTAGLPSAIYFTPSLLSQTATLATANMTAAAKAFTHAAQHAGEALPAGPLCQVKHDELLVAAAALGGLTVTAVNDTALLVETVGWAPVLSTTVAFEVSCQFLGAVDAPLQLPQRGQVNFSLLVADPATGAATPAVRYVVPIAVDASTQRVTLLPPALLSIVTATAVYGYRSEGFAADLFVASYFEATLARRLEAEFTALLTYPSPFAATWHAATRDLLALVQFACTTAAPPAPAPAGSLAVRLRGCDAPAEPNVYFPPLAEAARNVLLTMPSSSGNAAAPPGALPAHIAAAVRALPPPPRMDSVSVADDNAAPTCAAIPCPPAFAMGHVALAFAACGICYPNNGLYTQFAAQLTPSSV